MVNMSMVNPSHVKHTMWNVSFGTNELAVGGGCLERLGNFPHFACFYFGCQRILVVKPYTGPCPCHLNVGHVTLLRFSFCPGGLKAATSQKAWYQQFHLSWIKWGKGFVIVTNGHVPAQHSLFEVQWTSVLCCTVFMYSKVQTVQSITVHKH